MLIVKIATNRSTIEPVKRSIGIGNKEAIVKDVAAMARKERCLANQARDWTGA